MTELLSTTKGKAVAGGIVGALLLLAVWFLLVAPQRSRAAELSSEVEVAQADLVKRRAALLHPAANVTVRPSDLYRLTKALPDDTDMAGILLDVDRLAKGNGLSFSSLTPSPKVLGTGYVQQPLAVVVQGRFRQVSSFLGDLRTLVSVRGGRLDARGRLYSVSKVEISAPDGKKTFPLVKAAVTLNAYSYSPQPATPGTSPSTPTTDTSGSSGTVAAGANP